MSLSSSAVAARQQLAPSAPVSSGLFLSPGKSTFLYCLLLIAVVLVAYNPVTHNGFVRYDDDEYITNNPHVKAGLTWSTVKWAFTT